MFSVSIRFDLIAGVYSFSASLIIMLHSCFKTVKSAARCRLDVLKRESGTYYTVIIIHRVTKLV